MPARPISDVDMIKELRLRRWAREHYVEEEKRSVKWHPVVLEEMARRDAELDFQASMSGLGSRYVPLAPTPIRFRHNGHSGLAAPNFLSRMMRDVPTYIPG